MLATFFAIVFIVITAIMLTRKYNSQAVLILMGFVMLTATLLLGLEVKSPVNPTGLVVFDLISLLKDAMTSKAAGVGMMIMTIGGFVAYMKHIGASNALVQIASKPIQYLDKSPYLAASCVIPIGQFLFMCAPSATGLGLLLMAAIYPVLSELKISKVSIVAVITAATVFDLGPASANTNQAAFLIGMETVQYFTNYQAVLAISMTVCLMVLYFFVNRHFDKKMDDDFSKKEDASQELLTIGPKFYAILPVLPLFLLFGFSPFMGNAIPRFFQLIWADFPSEVNLSTIPAMLTALFISILIEIAVKRDLQKVLAGLKIFWEGMGKVFASVVTLIFAAELFSEGLKSLGFVDALVNGATSLGLGFVGITVVMTVMIFGASLLMGSGNASFFAFGALVPNIVKKITAAASSTLGASAIAAMESKMILCMQFASSMGRACSPIAGVIIATSEIAGISSFDLARRNLIPLSVGVVIMFVFQFLVFPLFLNQFVTP